MRILQTTSQQKYGTFLKDIEKITILKKGDAVDAALADYLNNNKDAAKYRVLFIRESEGVYQFGSKKIYIKIEGDKVLSKLFE